MIGHPTVSLNPFRKKWHAAHRGGQNVVYNQLLVAYIYEVCYLPRHTRGEVLKISAF